jgi:Ca2+-transporting ATPase
MAVDHGRIIVLPTIDSGEHRITSTGECPTALLRRVAFETILLWPEEFAKPLFRGETVLLKAGWYDYLLNQANLADLTDLTDRYAHTSQLKDLAGIENLAPSAAIEALDTTADGLRSAQVDERLKLYGLNTIQKLAKKSLVKAFFANFVHLMAWLLWVAGALAFVAGMPQLGIAVWMVNVINGCFSFWQEFQAGKATEALLSLLPVNAHVIRSGQELLIPAQQLVPGDVIVLAEGDAISADCRIISASRLAVDESTLSGEARPVRKLAESVAANDSSASNLLFAGTSVIAGTCRAVVCKTGMNTRFGKIARLTQSVMEQPSPLQNEMARVTRW